MQALQVYVRLHIKVFLDILPLSWSSQCRPSMCFPSIIAPLPVSIVIMSASGHRQGSKLTKEAVSRIQATPTLTLSAYALR